MSYVQNRTRLFVQALEAQAHSFSLSLNTAHLRAMALGAISLAVGTRDDNYIYYNNEAEKNIKLVAGLEKTVRDFFELAQDIKNDPTRTDRALGYNPPVEYEEEARSMAYKAGEEKAATKDLARDIRRNARSKSNAMTWTLAANAYQELSGVS